MRAVQTTAWGQPPTFTNNAEPHPSSSDKTTITVLASGLSRLTRSQALGQHYSATSRSLPYTPGSDGVGSTPSGDKVYFISMSGDAWAESANINNHAIFPLRPDADATLVAGLVNPAMASWMALRTRVFDLKRGFTILIIGATSLSGRVAIHNARRLGASKVIGVARNQAKLASLGLDESIILQEDPSKTDWSPLTSGDIDVILDNVYGPVVVAALAALKTTKPVQYVNVGSMAGLETSYPAALLRKSNLTMRGSGPGAWSMQDLGKEMPAMLEAVQDLPKELGKEIVARKLEEVDEAWALDDGRRIVFVPQEK